MTESETGLRLKDASGVLSLRGGVVSSETLLARRSRATYPTAQSSGHPGYTHTLCALPYCAPASSSRAARAKRGRIAPNSRCQSPGPVGAPRHSKARASCWRRCAAMGAHSRAIAALSALALAVLAECGDYSSNWAVIVRGGGRIRVAAAADDFRPRRRSTRPRSGSTTGTPRTPCLSTVS